MFCVWFLPPPPFKFVYTGHFPSSFFIMGPLIDLSVSKADPLPGVLTIDVLRFFLQSPKTDTYFFSSSSRIGPIANYDEGFFFFFFFVKSVPLPFFASRAHRRQSPLLFFPFRAPSHFRSVRKTSTFFFPSKKGTELSPPPPPDASSSFPSPLPLYHCHRGISS